MAVEHILDYVVLGAFAAVGWLWRRVADLATAAVEVRARVTALERTLERDEAEIARLRNTVGGNGARRP